MVLEEGSHSLILIMYCVMTRFPSLCTQKIQVLGKFLLSIFIMIVQQVSTVIKYNFVGHDGSNNGLTLMTA